MSKENKTEPAVTVFQSFPNIPSVRDSEFQDLPSREASPVPDCNIMAPALSRSSPIAEASHHLTSRKHWYSICQRSPVPLVKNLRRQSKNVQPLSPQSPDTRDFFGGTARNSPGCRSWSRCPCCSTGRLPRWDKPASPPPSPPLQLRGCSRFHRPRSSQTHRKSICRQRPKEP